MSLGSFVAGGYVGSYSAAALGMVERGYELSFVPNKELITNSDTYAATVLDGIWQGFSGVFMGGTFMEWNAAALAAVTPYDNLVAAGVDSFGMGVIGRLDTDVAAALLLTSTAGTPAVASPATLTATEAILAEGFNVNWLFGPSHRKVPFRFRLYPYLDTTVKFFSVT